jgi:hypothetical protein
MMPRAADIVAAAGAYAGVAWKHQGRAGHGLDCLGLLIVAALDAGLEHARGFMDMEGRRYGMMPPNALARELVKAGMVRAPAAVAGGVGLFAQPGSYPSHVGIFAAGAGEPLEIIHASALERKVVRHLFDAADPLMQPRAFFLYPGVDY